MGSSFSGRSSVVVRRRSPRGGDLSSLAFSRPNVLVRCLQSRLGSHGRRPFRFRSLARGRGLSLDQSLRVVGRREGPQGSLCLFGRPSCRSFLRQHDRGGVSEKARRDFVSDPECGSPAHSALGEAVEHNPDASVCSWQEQRGGGCSVSAQSGSRLGVDAPSGSVQLAPPALASDNRSVCLLTQSPLFSLFCSCVGPHGCGYRCHAPVMGFATGLCFPSVCHDQPGPGEGEGLPGSGAHSHTSILAPTSVVSGASRALILPPHPLPSRWDLLRQPHVRRFHQNLSMLRLHEWRHSGDSRGSPASLVAWLDDLVRRGGSLQ